MFGLRSLATYTLLVALSAILLWGARSSDLWVLQQLAVSLLVGSLVAAPIALFSAKSRGGVFQSICRHVLGGLVFSAVFFAAGEGALRLLFWEGESFGSHFGPIVKRFERDFRYNRYDGPSRGPSISESTSSQSLRVFVQGDSITWG